MPPHHHSHALKEASLHTGLFSRHSLLYSDIVKKINDSEIVKIMEMKIDIFLDITSMTFKFSGNVHFIN